MHAGYLMAHNIFLTIYKYSQINSGSIKIGEQSNKGSNLIATILIIVSTNVCTTSSRELVNALLFQGAAR